MTDHSKQIRAENRALHTRSMEHPEDGVLTETRTATPGPWHFTQTGRGTYIRRVEDFKGDVAIAEIFKRGDYGAQDANARLIAAAPDLLAALERLGAKQFDGSWHTVTCYPNYLGPGSICLSQCVQARDAIQKARGQ